MCAKLPYVPNNIFLSMVVIMQNTAEKASLQKTKVNDMKGLCRQTELEKNGGPIGLVV